MLVHRKLIHKHVTLAADTAASPRWERNSDLTFGCKNGVFSTTVVDLKIKIKKEKGLQPELLQLSSDVFSAHCNPSHTNVQCYHVCPQTPIILRIFKR